MYRNLIIQQTNVNVKLVIILSQNNKNYVCLALKSIKTVSVVMLVSAINVNQVDSILITIKNVHVRMDTN